MWERLKRQLTLLMENLESSVRRFPETIAMAVGVVVVGIVMNHMDYQRSEDLETLSKYLMTFILGAPMMTYGVLLSERLELGNAKRLGISAAIAAFLVFYRLTMPQDLGNYFAVQYSLLLTSGFLLFSLVPYAFNRENYSRYVLHLVTHFFITLLFSLVLYLGINAIIFTIEQLFELNIDNEIHLDTFIIIAGLFAVTHFLGHVPKVKEGVADTYYPPVLRVLFVYIIVPLLSVYTAILYAYFVRLILMREFPINMLGHLVVWYGLISVVILFFVHRIRDRNAFVDKFYKWFPVIILVPLGMLFAAIISRIADYGLTPARYFVLISGIWILGSMLYIKFTRQYRSTLIVAAAIVVLLVSGFGPQSAFNLSLSNQLDRFETLLIDNDMLSEGAIVPRENLNVEEQREISEFVRYFDRQHDLDQVPMLPKDFEIKDMEETFGFKYVDYYPREFRNVGYYFDRESLSIDISEYDLLIEGYLHFEENTSYETDGLEWTFDNDTRIFEVIWQGESLVSVDILEAMKAYHEERKGYHPNTVEEATLPLGDTGDRVKMIINNMHYELDNQDEIEYGSLHFKLLIKK